MPLSSGTRLGRYEIRSQLGAGGMGEVYLADDTQLGRRVALKLLPAQAMQDQDSLRRFQQEARAASALSHPNIAHIYEIGEADGVNFIAMEYVAGQSLTERINSQPMTAAEVVSIGAQVADALDEAHQAGVTHRDIKSANIMLDARGRVKVLDFGLAKMVAPETESEAATRVKTKPGVVMGTVSYMSPEQAMGRETDARTDIWSLGVVLYEMATGRLPFAGESVTETIDAIVHAQPEAVARFNYDVPAELEVVIKKALRKKREERYQTAHDLLVDLQSLARELELNGERSVAPESRRVGAQSQAGAGASNTSLTAQQSIAPGSEQVTRTLTREQTATTDAVTAGHTASSAEYIVEKIRGHKKGVAVALVLLFVALPVGGFTFYRLWSVHQHPDEARAPLSSFQNAKITRLTTTGRATRAAISPDGKYIVHVKSEGGQESLWLRQVATTSDTQIVAPSDNRYWGLTFSPDGDYVYYTTAGSNFNSLARSLYQVPALGGASRKVLDGVTSPVSFSPDGKRFAFVRYAAGERDESILMLANADGSGEQKIATRTTGQFSPEGLAWSPDGKVIAGGAVGFGGVRYYNLVTVNVADGTEKEVTSQRWGYTIGQVAWLADGSGLVMVARERTPGTPRQLWYVSYPDGETRKITNDLNEYVGVSIAADSGTLVTVQSDTTANVSIAPATDASRVRQITNAKTEGLEGLSWMPDGRIVYDSNASGSNNIWVMDQDGRNQKQLTNDTGNNHTPSATPDGRYIIFNSGRGLPTGQNVWRMNADGSNPVQLTHGTNEFWVRSSPDSKWAIYTSTDSGKDAVWKVPVDGGERVKLTEKDSRNGSISPDMKLMACLYREEQVGSPFKVAIALFDDGQLVKLLDIPQFIEMRAGFRWSTDGRALDYIDTRGGISNVWSLPIDGSPPKQLTDFNAEQIFAFDLSRDGKQFAFSRGTVTNDVVLIKDFR